MVNKKFIAIIMAVTLVNSSFCSENADEQNRPSLLGPIFQLTKDVGKDSANIITLGTQPELNNNNHRSMRKRQQNRQNSTKERDNRVSQSNPYGSSFESDRTSRLTDGSHNDMGNR